MVRNRRFFFCGIRCTTWQLAISRFYIEVRGLLRTQSSESMGYKYTVRVLFNEGADINASRDGIVLYGAALNGFKAILCSFLEGDLIDEGGWIQDDEPFKAHNLCGI
jgi:hypothetical protein